MQWTFQPVGGPWFTAVVVAVLLGLVVVVPRPRPTGGRLWTLRGMRLAIVLLMLAALVRPTLTKIDKKPLTASLLILIDESRSLQVADSLGGATRWEAARRMLRDSAGDLARLAEKWEVRAFRFAGEVTETELAGGRLELPADPTGESTSLGDALEEALDRGGGERLLGVILLSDGAQRALPPRDAAPQVAVRRLVAEGVPLYTATLGQPGVAGQADLAIEDLAASESAFVKAPTEVSARLRVSGFANRQFTVQLLWEDKAGEMQVVDSRRIDTGPQSGAYRVRLEHTPLEPGEHKVTVRVVSASGGAEEGELVTSNNQRSTFISVRDGGVKVQQLIGPEPPGYAPGREQRFVRSALAASPDIAVTRVLFD
ncbi:MAG: vWA domain-containing protein, partial [Planctomycetota bacterium]